MECMIDIETLGTRADAVVVQIGAVLFNDEGPVDYGVRIDVSPDWGIRNGMSVDWATIAWWMEQSNDARAQMTNAGQGGVDGGVAIDCIRTYAWQFGHPTHWWANGAHFDFPILENMARADGESVPWQYHQVRDLRTIGDLGCVPEDRPRPTVAHDAMDDAMAQVQWLLNVRRRLATQSTSEGI